MFCWLRGSSLSLPSFLTALLPLAQAAEQAAAGRGHKQPVQTPAESQQAQAPGL